jgi:hypothetical protein
LLCTSWAAGKTLVKNGTFYNRYSFYIAGDKKMKKKLLTFPIITFVLFACSSNAQTSFPINTLQSSLTSTVIETSANSTQSLLITPSPSMVDSTNQTSSSEIDPTWKTYINKQVGFIIQYPSNWQEEDLPDTNAGQMHHIALKGPEGGVELAWGIGFGGACPSEGYQPMTIANGSWPACHSQKEDGTDQWSLAAQDFGNTTVAGFVYTNDTTAESRTVVLQVVSSLSVP